MFSALSLMPIIDSIYSQPQSNDPATLIDHMDSYDPLLWHKSDGRPKDPLFNSGWRASKVLFRRGLLTLQLDNQGCPWRCSDKPYASGELRTNQFYGRGLLEARLKAARGDGIVTSLFFHRDSPHDEIDIEILGKDPTKMQINYFTGGRGGHEKIIDLGFDASKGFHTYGILWTKKYIRWYVDGKLVHTERGRIPFRPGRIITNLWPVSAAAEHWAGHFRYSEPLRAEYDWVRFTPLKGLPKRGLPPAPIPKPAVPSPIIATIPTPARILPLPPFGIPDPELGKIDPFGKPRFNRREVEKKTHLEILEKILLEIIVNTPEDRVLEYDPHLVSPAKLKKHHPELAKIKELDGEYIIEKSKVLEIFGQEDTSWEKLFEYLDDNRLVSKPGIEQKMKTDIKDAYKRSRLSAALHQYHYKHYWYLRNFRSFWDNVILLFSLYVQKITESTQVNRKEKFRLALRLADKIEKRIDVQAEADVFLGRNKKDRLPISHSLATLLLTKAEIYAQTEGRGGLISKSQLEGFSLPAEKIWGALVRAGYIDKNGRTSPRAKENLGLDLNLEAGERAKISTLLRQSHDKAFYATRDFYEKGIEFVLSAIKQFLSSDLDPDYPSQPDYYSIFKGVLILSDLYARLANLTHRPDYYKISDYLYRSVIALDEKSGTGLRIDPSDLKLSAEVLPLSLRVSPQDIHHSLKVNLEETYITEKDRKLALLGIFRQLKGMALLRAAALFIAWPSRLKSIHQILDHFADTVFGTIELKEATAAAGLPDQKNDFFYTQAKLIQGELIRLLAFRINYYYNGFGTFLDSKNRLQHKFPLPPKFLGALDAAKEAFSRVTLSSFAIFEDKQKIIWKALTEEGYIDKNGRVLQSAPKSKDLQYKAALSETEAKQVFAILKQAAGNRARFEALEEELPILETNQLIAIARDFYFRDLPPLFKYLYSQSIVNLLEIAISFAEFVQETKKGKVPDATVLLDFCEGKRGFISEISKEGLLPEYLEISLNYLESILRLAGKRLKDARGRYIIGRIPGTGKRYIKDILFPLEGIHLVTRIEESLHALPKELAVYYEVHARLKEAGFIHQIIQHRNYKHLKSSPLLQERIRQKTGKKMKLIDYSFWLLQGIEKRLAPILPTYLWHNTAKTLPKFIRARKFGHKRVRANLQILRKFVEGNVKKYYPANYKDIKKKLNVLISQISSKKKAKSLEALDAFLKALAPLNANARNFEADYSEINTWDLHSVYAELYHLLAVGYNIDKKHKKMYQYGQSAFMESRRSSATYDQEHRPFFIMRSINNLPDVDVPVLREMVREMLARLPLKTLREILTKMPAGFAKYRKLVAEEIKRRRSSRP